MSVVMTPIKDWTTAGERVRVEFEVSNLSPESLSGVALEFEVAEPGLLVEAMSSHGECAEALCEIGPFDAPGTVTGHVTITQGRGFDTELRVDADVSWLLEDSTRRHSYGYATIPLTDGGLPGDLIWLTAVDSSGMSCGDGIEAGPDTLYATFGDKLVALSRSTGEALWFYRSSNSLYDPSLAEGNIYIDTRASNAPEDTGLFLRSVNASTGTLNWQQMVEGRLYGPAVILDESVHIVLNDADRNANFDYSYLLAFDVSTGVLNWRYRVEDWASHPPWSTEATYTSRLVARVVPLISMQLSPEPGSWLGNIACQ